MRSLQLALLALFAVSASGANPVRRVVTMLQSMQKKIAKEGERDKELFDKFMCYCKTGAGDLEKSIKDAETKMPAVTSELQEAKSQKEQLEGDLKDHEKARVDAKNALAEATSLREKEAATFAKASGDASTNIKAMGKAIAAIKAGMTGFLQTSSAAVVRGLVVDMDLSDVDREVLTSFLSQKQEGSYSPASGQIVGVLQEMLDTMDSDLAGLTKDETAAKADFEELVAAKQKEIAANTKAIEDKTARLGNVGVQIEELADDLEDTSASYGEDKKFLLDMDKNCATKQKEWDVVQKTRAEELLAISETIKILNDDDALDLFKKTLPSTSLLQIKLQSREVRQRALRVLHGSRRTHDSRLDLISLSIRGKKVSFDKVLGMIDEMVKLLGSEQVSDDEKKAYCEKELDSNEDLKKQLDLDVSDHTKAIDETEDAIATLKDEIEALVVGIKALDTSVADATANRQQENKEYKDTMASNTVAKEILKKAKGSLNNFYNPKQADASAPSLVQVAAHMRRSSDSGAPPPPPETFGAYTKKGEESAGVLSMVDMLIGDLDKEMTAMDVEEKDAQADYETYIKDSADKRAADSKSIEAKEGAKAAAEEAFNKLKLEKKSKAKESYETATLLRDLHLECDWLISNFETRKEARADEIDSLQKAKAVLSGADFELVQTASKHRVFLAKHHA